MGANIDYWIDCTCGYNRVGILRRGEAQEYLANQNYYCNADSPPVICARSGADRNGAFYKPNQIYVVHDVMVDMPPVWDHIAAREPGEQPANVRTYKSKTVAVGPTQQWNYFRQAS